MLLGDWVKEVTTKLGVKQCIPCQARQQRMNNFHTTTAKKIKSLLENFSSGSSGSQPSDTP